MSGTSGFQGSQTNSSLAGKIETNQLAQELMEGKSAPILLPNNHPAISAQPLPLNQHFKEWHTSVTSECRKYQIHRFVIALFPTTDPRAMLDKRMDDLVEYAKDVEGNTYSTTKSRYEYFHLMADRIYETVIQTSGTFSKNTVPRTHGDPTKRLHDAVNQTPHCSLSTHQVPSCLSKDQTTPGETITNDR